ncbi:hypothetical protein BDF14DRAFT_1741800 [Spinellus fusiger]|nr:hypothetical protein BDF14DRAFT_1741800 [Spinellus fusiger]
MSYQDTTDKRNFLLNLLCTVELQAEYEQRSANLMNGVSGVLGSLENSQKVFTDMIHQDTKEAQEMQDGQQTMNAAGNALNTTTRTTGNSASNALNQSAMNAVRRDIASMKSCDASQFETAAAKLDETFGGNALTESGPGPTL